MNCGFIAYPAEVGRKHAEGNADFSEAMKKLHSTQNGDDQLFKCFA